MTPNTDPLTRADFEDDANRIGCTIEAIQAVFQVESAGNGFCPDGFPKILFEGHHFSKLTNGKFDLTNPTISYPKWTRQFYGKTWQDERARFDRAVSLDRSATLLSTSWGAPQIMGSNFAVCGYKTVQAFVNAMCSSHNAQLEAFTTFVIARGLADELRDKRWADFARLYNGPSYHINKYDQKMAQAYAKLQG